MMYFLREIDLVPQDAGALFALLDVDGSGEIDAEELIAGLMRFTGTSKAFDLAVFIHDYSKQQKFMHGRLDSMEATVFKSRKTLRDIVKSLEELKRLQLRQQ